MDKICTMASNILEEKKHVHLALLLFLSHWNRYKVFRIPISKCTKSFSSPIIRNEALRDILREFRDGQSRRKWCQFTYQQSALAVAPIENYAANCNFQSHQFEANDFYECQRLLKTAKIVLSHSLCVMLTIVRTWFECVVWQMLNFV